MPPLLELTILLVEVGQSPTVTRMIGLSWQRHSKRAGCARRPEPQIHQAPG
jgi:hypothetical protein